MKKPRPSHRPQQAAQAPTTRTMADLRPQAGIWCMYCDQQRPQAGAQKFHAHHVCRECVTKLQTLPDSRPANTRKTS